MGLQTPSMQFGSDRDLEARIGRVCIVYSRVEHEVGHVVQAAVGNWDLAATSDYLDASSAWGELRDWLKDVGKAHPELQPDVVRLRDGLRDLKSYRDKLAHSAAIVDGFLLMREQGKTSMSFPDPAIRGKLLNARTGKHFDPPTDADVDAFCARASDVGDAAQALALAIARLVAEGGAQDRANS